MGETDLGATMIYPIGPAGEEGEGLFFANTFSHAYLPIIMEELSALKKIVEKKKAVKAKKEYKKWEKTEEGQASIKETMEMQADDEETED